MIREIDISKVLIEGDTATIMGVKYKRVEEPKPTPETLYDIVRHTVGYSIDCCDEILDAVEEWLPDELEYGDVGGAYERGWNAAIRTIKQKLR